MSDIQFKDFEDYLEQLCRLNADVAHNPPAQVSFSRLRSQDEINAIINNAGKNIVLMGRFNGRATGDADEQAMRTFVVVRFACYAEQNDGDISGGIDDAIDKAWNIMHQFIAKMRQDYKADTCSGLGDLEYENISWQEIDEPVFLENHYGWDCTIPFTSFMEPHDNTKWVAP